MFWLAVEVTVQRLAREGVNEGWVLKECVQRAAGKNDCGEVGVGVVVRSWMRRQKRGCRRIGSKYIREEGAADEQAR
jgi:hypothetical protein